MYGQLFDQNGQLMEQGPAQQIRDDLSLTLRSVRDTLSQSFQTLNLTMAGISNTLRTMSANMPRANLQASMTYVPAYGSMNLAGALSGPMSANLANTSTWGIMTGDKPYNVSGMEWGWNRHNELNHRSTQFGLDASLQTASLGISTGAGSLATLAARSRYAPAALRNFAMGRLGGALIGGAGMVAAGMVLDPIVGAYSDAANVYGRDIAGIRRMSTRFGNEFTNQQAGVVAKGIGNYGYREIMNTTDFDTRLGSDGYRNVLMQGLQMNMFQGRKPEELVKQMENAASVVKFLTGILGSKDVQETMQQVGNLKNMGINMLQNPSYAMQMGASTYKYSQMMGVNGAQLLQQASHFGSNAYGQYGMPGFGGIIPAMQNMALAHELEKRRMLSTAEIAAAGGHSALAGQGVQLTAAMMNNGSIGKMMLAAGWAGGGNFNFNKFNSAVGQGYFPAMHQALASISGDPSKYAEFMMNQENLYASASAQGGLDGNVKKMLFAALDKMHGMQDENSAAYMIKQIGQSMGVNVPTALAKQWSMERSRPNTFAAMNAEANRHLDRGMYYENAQRYSRFRGLGEIGEAYNKVKGGAYHLLVEKPAQEMRDWWSENVIGESDRMSGMMTYGSHSFTAGTVENLRKVLNSGMSPNNLKVNEDAYKLGYNLADREAGLGGNTGFFDSLRNMPGMEDARAMAPAIQAMTSKHYKKYFESVLDTNGMTSSEAFARLGKYAGYTDYNLMMTHMSRDGGKYAGKMAGGLQWIADNMSDANLSELSGATRSTKWYQGLDANKTASILASAGIDTSKFGRGDADNLMNRILNAKSSDLDAIAKANGLTRENLAYGLTTQAMGGDAGLSKLYRLMGSSSQNYDNLSKIGGALARENGWTIGVDRNLLQTENNMTIGMDQMASSLKALGLTYDDISTIIDNNKENGSAQIQNFGKSVDNLVRTGKLSQEDWDGIQDPILKKRLDALMKDKNTVKNITGDNYLGFGNKSGTLEAKLGTLLNESMRGSALDRITRGVQGIWGLDVTSSDIIDAVNNGGMSSLVLKSKGGTKELADVREKLQRVQGSSIQELRDQFGEAFNNVSDKDLQKTIMESIATTSMDKMQKEADLVPKKGSVESAIDEYGGKGVMRVMLVADKIKEVEKEVREKESTSTKPQTIDNLASRPNFYSNGIIPSPATKPSNSNSSFFNFW